MTADERPPARPPAWLVGASEDLAGLRYRLNAEVIAIGRDPQNDIVLEGPRSGVVSKRHARVEFKGNVYRLTDLKSRNGTFVNSKPCRKAVLRNQDRVQLGVQGPEFEFRLEVQEALPETMVGGIAPLLETEQAEQVDTTLEGEEELREAVRRARAARGAEGTGQTLMIMRKLFKMTQRSSTRKLRRVAISLSIPLVLVSIFAAYSQHQLSLEKAELDREISTVEQALLQASDPQQIDSLIAVLDEYQKRARDIQRSLLYRLGLRDEVTDFIESQIQQLMLDLGAAQYSIPAEFRERVEFYISRYQEQDRDHLEKALEDKREVLEEMRKVFSSYNLPADLAFITVVESAFNWTSVSPNGAAGPWQFVPATARAFGLKVEEGVDERFDLEKSTQAAANYVRRLISEFGAGTSAMLALAAYNLGPTRVRQAVREIEDPIKQRSFWYLYRNRTLPAETREYIPKIVAVIIMLRNPEFFGFQRPAFNHLS